jgi:formylmethanofuran dehydrogenase subunit E
VSNVTITQELIEETTNFHGHWCPGLAIGIRAAEWALREMCTFGKGNLIHKDYGKNAFTFYRRQDGKAVRLVARPGIYGDTGAILGKLHRKMLEEGLSGEEEKVWRETRAAIAKRIMESKLTDLFEMKPPADPVPRMARILAPMVCESCGEAVMETRTRHFGGQLLCIPCFETKEKR